MQLKLISPPNAEPITTEEAVSYLRLGTIFPDESTYLSSLIKSAREYCENLQGRAYITQTWELTLDEFPDGSIYLPKGELQSVNSFKFIDFKGAENTLVENVDYIVGLKSNRLSPVFGGSWYHGDLRPLDAISIVFTCGYGDSKSFVPETTKQAMFMLISYWWDNRTAADSSLPKEVEFSVHALLGGVNKIYRA